MSNLSITFDAPKGGGGAKGEGAGPLDIRHFSVTELLSEPFAVHLVVLSPSPDLDPGEYVAICLIPDAATGQPHLALGMIQGFTVE